MSRHPDQVFLLKIVTAFNNRGDLLINRALIQNLRKHGSVRAVTGHMPQEFANNLGLRSEEVCESMFGEILRNLTKRRLFVVGIPGHNYGGLSQLPPAAIGLAKTLLFRLLLNVRFIKVGSSMGPLHQTVVLTERLKSLAYSLYGVRDKASVELCHASKVKYFPDLAFVSEDLVRDSVTTDHSHTYFLSFRDHMNEGDAGDQYLTTICKRLTDHLTSARPDKVVIGFQVPCDRKPCRKLHQSLQAIEGLDVEFIDQILDLDDAIDQVRRADFVISNRLHVLLPALIMEVPHIALTDLKVHFKIQSLYETIGADFVLHDLADERELAFCEANSPEGLRKIATEQRKLGTEMLDSILETVR